MAVLPLAIPTNHLSEEPLNVLLREEGEGKWQDMLLDEHLLQDGVLADAEEARDYFWFLSHSS